MYKKTTKEIWNPVVGYQGLYEVSNLGRVKSLDRYGRTKGNGRRLIKGKILFRRPEQDGYQRIQLFKKGKYINKYVHSLVMESFVGPCPKNQQVIHLEHVSIHGNNELSNLRYGSACCNMAFKIDDGTSIRGEKSLLAKLTKNEVIKIRKLCKGGGHTQFEIGKMFGVKHNTISAIKTRVNWNHIP